MKTLLALCAIALSGLAMADGTVPIVGQGNIQYPCSISNGTVNFGSVNRQSRSTQRSSFTVTVDCPLDSTYKVYQSGDGAITAGTQTIYMNLFSDNTYSTHMTQASGYISGVGIGGNQSITIYPELSATPNVYSSIDLMGIPAGVGVNGTLTGLITVEF